MVVLLLIIMSFNVEANDVLEKTLATMRTTLHCRQKAIPAVAAHLKEEGDETFDEKEDSYN